LECSARLRWCAREIGVIDEDYAHDGVELTVVWGEPDGGTSKPGVERHVQADIRAVVSTGPLN